MPQVIACASCRGRFRVPDTAAGKQIKCPRCASVLRVPAGEAEAIAPEPVPSEGITSAPPVVPALPAGLEVLPAPAPRRRRGGDPSRDWVDHRGHRPKKNADFISDPPAEIGAVQTAHTTLTKENHGWPMALKVPFVIAFTLAGLGVGIGIVYWAGVESGVWRCVWIGLGLLLGLSMGVGAENFAHRLT